jgi:hypothetical protein
MLLKPFSLRLLFILIWCAGATAQVRPREKQQQQPSSKGAKGEVGKYSGPGGCAASNCHGSVQPKTLTHINQNEFSIWASQDKHQQAYAVLSKPVSLRMGKILGLEQAPSKSDKCLVCHALDVPADHRAGSFQLDDGVSCENCHGPAVGWLGPHTVKGWTHQQSLQLGMYDTRDLVKRSEKCLSCHLGTPEKEVDHTMLAAGHPDLTFELESFSSAMPRHWGTDGTNNPWVRVQELAIGQSVQLREALNRLSRRASGPNWPEYAEYECFACHHSLTGAEASWRQSLGYHGRQPGAPVWNPSRYVVFRYIARAIDASAADSLVTELQKIMLLSGKATNALQVSDSAKRAAESAGRLAEAISTHRYDGAMTLQILQSITDDANAIAALGERPAEQATMAVDSLSLAYSKNEKVANASEIRAAVTALFKQFDSPSSYNAPHFAAQMQKVGALLPRGQGRSSGGAH